MREIKFRGIDLDGNFRYGFFKRVGAYSWIQNEQGGDEAVIQNTVGQFTGLKDKNGKDIYEGDILKYKYYKDYGQSGELIDMGNIVVKWIDPKAAFDPLYYWTGYSEQLSTCEVIGDIHRNPELLK